MQTYIVRVYRTNTVDEGAVSGVIEEVESGQTEPFSCIDEIEPLLTKLIMKGQLEIPGLVTSKADAYENVAVIG